LVSVATRRHPQAAISTPTCQQPHRQRGTRPTPSTFTPTHTKHLRQRPTPSHTAIIPGAAPHIPTGSQRRAPQHCSHHLQKGYATKHVHCAAYSPEQHQPTPVIPTQYNFDGTHGPHRHVCFIMQGTGSHSALHATATVGVQTTVMQSVKKHRPSPSNQGTTPKPRVAARCSG
jgi:hypothetical protein